MTVLVTGGAGYIGSVTVERLRAKGEHVVVLDDLVRGHRSAVEQDVPFYHGNVGDRALVERIAGEHKIEACVHFAALAYVGESVVEPAKYFENNVEQGIALMGALVEAGVRRVVFSSTCATYGEPKQVPIPESSPQWPVNPYGWSKLLMERLLASLRQRLRVEIRLAALLQCGGSHGALRRRPRAGIASGAERFESGLGEKTDVVCFWNELSDADGTAIRDYVHVADLAEAHILALEYLRRGGESDFLNLGTGHGYSVMEVIECARKVTGRPIPTRIEGPRAGDPPSLVADAQKAETVLGWKPTMSDLASILRSQWEWRQKHPRGYAE